MRRSSLFWGIVLILAGLIFLLDSLGILRGVNIWSLIWPVFLIALGIWTLWGTVFRRAPEMEHARVPLEGAARARVRLNHGAGRLAVSAGGENENLVEGDFGGGVDVSARREGDLQVVRLSMPAQFFPFSWGPGYTLDWNVSLNRGVPLALELETGAGESRVDLSDLNVTDLSVKTGASSTHLILPANAGQTRVDIRSGVASVDVQVPAGVAARIRTRGGLSNISIDQGRFPRQGDAYQSADYASAANRVDLDVEMGVGSVTIR